MSIVSFHCVPRIVQLCYIFVVRGRTDFEHLEMFVNKPVRYWQTYQFKLRLGIRTVIAANGGSHHTGGLLDGIELVADKKYIS